MENTVINKRDLWKFILYSALGILAFLVPLNFESGVNTLLGVGSDWVKRLLSDFFTEIVLVLVVVSTVGSLVDTIFKGANKKLPNWFHNQFNTNTVYLITKIVALIISFSAYFNLGPGFVVEPNTGGAMLNLAQTLVAIAFVLSYVLPFLTDSGLMEFGGVVTHPFVRPMFKVPSDASVDLLASWMGASSAAVILSAEKYHRGYYNKRETACVMCNFSLVSIPFCMVIACTADIAAYFPVMYLLLCVLGILLAVIMPRIYPLNKLSNEYYEDKKFEAFSMKAPKGIGMLKFAFVKGCETAHNFGFKNVLRSGTSVLCTVLLTLVPIVIAWGTIGMVLVTYTPVFNWIAIPFEWIFSLFNVADAAIAAPAALVGFVDMFIPSLLITNVSSIETRFIIATLSLIQIIYITEVGAVIIQTKIGVDFKRLFLIFLERTIISLPIIILVAKLIF